MIQRLQTLWLLLASLLLFSLFFLPLIEVVKEPVVYQMQAGSVKELLSGHIVNSVSFWWVNMAVAVTGFYVFILIFLYKNRSLQKALCYVGIVVLALLCLVLMQSAQNVFHLVELKASHFQIAGLFPSMAIALLILSIRGIKKDENLIKVADRLR